MDRASDSGSEGWGFESLPAYQNKSTEKMLIFSSFSVLFLTFENYKIRGTLQNCAALRSIEKEFLWQFYGSFYGKKRGAFAPLFSIRSK